MNGYGYSSDELNQLLSYDPEMGILYWRIRTSDFFKNGCRSAQSEAGRWNKRHAGAPAGTVTHGYIQIRLPNRKLGLAHRLIWQMTYGEVPDVIDHIDGDTLNNRLENFRNGPQQQNMRNMRKHKHNRSGVTGVCVHGRTGRWLSFIKVDGKSQHLGLTHCFGKAFAARRAAEMRYGFSARHGN